MQPKRGREARRAVDDGHEGLLGGPPAEVVCRVRACVRGVRAGQRERVGEVATGGVCPVTTLTGCRCAMLSRR